MKYKNNLTLTNPRRVPFSLSNQFDDTFGLTDMVSDCKNAEDFCAAANKYDRLLKLDLLHMFHMENGVLHKEKDMMSRMIQTNMGEMPLQDYLDIRALECGFDSYKELEKEGFSIEIPETSKEKEQTLVPRPD